MEKFLSQVNLLKTVLIIFVLFTNFDYCQVQSKNDNLTLVGSYNTDGYAKDVVVNGNFAYVADSDSGLCIIDISNHATPVKVGGVITNGSSTNIFLSGNLAYIAEGYSTIVFSIVDVSEPENPVKIGVANRDIVELVDGEAVGIQVANGYAYVADFNGRMHQFNVTDSTNPFLTNVYLNSEGYSSGVFILNDLLFFTDHIRMYIYNISNPNSPYVVRTHTFFSTYNSDYDKYPIQVTGNYAFIANTWPGFKIIDISVPDSTRNISLTYVEDGTKNIYALGQYAYISTKFNNKLLVYDISNPASPNNVGYAETNGTPEGLFAKDNYVYLACGTEGLLIFKNDLISDVTSEPMPVKFNLEQNYPNPFNPSTTISYQLPKSGFVNLTVYNSLGQKIAILVNENQTSGKYSVKFDASNLPSGVYFYKLQSGNFSETKKLVLLR